MKYESIKHSFLVILIATTIVGCAGNSVQPPASQYQTSSESFDSRSDTSSIDFEDVDKEEMAKQECRNLGMCQISPPEQSLGKAVGGIIITTAFIAALVTVAVVAPEVAILTTLMVLSGGG